MLVQRKKITIEGYVYSIMHDEDNKPSYIHIDNPYTGKNSVIVPIDSIKKVLELVNGLSDEEIIDLAPDWATHYFIDKNGNIMFESEEFYQWEVEGICTERHKQAIPEVSENAKPIPKSKRMPSGTVVPKTEVRSQKDLDSMAEAAAANGFDMDTQNNYRLSKYVCDYIGVFDGCGCLQSLLHDEANNVVTLEEFLSYKDFKQ